MIVALKWKPQGKRPRGKPKKRWIDMVEEDLKTLGVENWIEAIQDRSKWLKLLENRPEEKA